MQEGCQGSSQVLMMCESLVGEFWIRSAVGLLGWFWVAIH